MDISTFCRSVSHDIARGALNHSLARIYRHVDTLVTTPSLMPQPIGNAELDALCQRIGAENLTRIKPLKPVTSEHTLHVYIATKLQKSGGHTKVIEQLIAANPVAQHLVLVTERMGRSDRSAMLEKFAGNDRVKFQFCAARSWLDTLRWLQRELLIHAPDVAYLFNHHQDSAAVAALQPDMVREAYFYHHGDHHFCLGVTLPFLTHVDLHAMGYHQCRRELGIDNQYLPLVVADRAVRPDAPFMVSGTLTTATAARNNKIAAPYFIHYGEVIPTLLKATGGRHVHMGTLSQKTLRTIHRAMQIHDVPRERFVYIPFVPSVWDALVEHQVDLYVASFPIGGGLTMVEAMGAGIPIALHDHLTSPLLRSAELAYPGAFHWRFPQQLYVFAAKLTPAFLADQSRRARAHYAQHHVPSLLAQANVQPAPDQSASFKPAPEAWPNWQQDLFSPRRRAMQWVYRYARRLRATLDIYR